MSMLKMLVEIVGWAGAVTMLTAYLLLTAGRLSANSARYQWLNVAAAAAFIVNSGWNGAYPSACLNLVWMTIGLYGLARLTRPTPAGTAHGASVPQGAA